MRFEWDAAKAAANRKKHRVSFEDAATVFGDPLALARPDTFHPERENLVGVSLTGTVLFIVYVEDRETIRLISARRATAHERKRYEDGET